MAFLDRNLVVPNRREKIAGFIYWPFYLMLTGLLLSLLFLALGMDLESQEGVFLLNIAFFIVNFLAVAAILHDFLFRSFAPITSFGRLILAVLTGYGVYCALNIPISVALEITGYVPSNLNQDAVETLTSMQPLVMLLCTVVLAPVTEECLCRGLIFGPICRRSPVLAYIVSAAVFSAIHVVGSIGESTLLDLAVCFVIYLPAGLGLAFAYHRSRSIWGSILLHAAINLLAFVVSFPS